MTKPYSLLLDIGGTDLKLGQSIDGVLVSTSIERNSISQFENLSNHTIDSKKLLEFLISQINSYIEKLGKPSSILLSSQMGSWILTADNGEELSPIYSWQFYSDFESELADKVFGNDLDKSTLRIKNNGGETWPGVPWKKLLSDLNHIHKENKVYFHTLGSWLTWQLTNRTNHQIHLSDAAATGMVDIIEGKWVGKFSEIHANFLRPKIVNGMTSNGFFLSSDIPLYVCIGDQQASVLGVAKDESKYIINAGTGGQVVKMPPVNQNSRNKIRPYFAGNYIETITHLPSGRFLTKYLDHIRQSEGVNLSWEWLCERGTIEYFNSVDREVMDLKYENFVDSYPFEKEDKDANADLFLNHICDGFISALRKLGCQRGDTVFLAGGMATKVKLMTKVLADVYGINVVTSKTEETTLEGLAKLSKLL